MLHLRLPTHTETNDSYVCQDHFEPSMYISRHTYRHAVPHFRRDVPGAIHAVPHISAVPEDNSHMTIIPNSHISILANKVPVYSSDILENDEAPDDSAEAFAVPGIVEILSDGEEDVSDFIWIFKITIYFSHLFCINYF